jgi:hypothetical protein
VRPDTSKEKSPEALGVVVRTRGGDAESLKDTEVTTESAAATPLTAGGVEDSVVVPEPPQPIATRPTATAIAVC